MQRSGCGSFFLLSVFLVIALIACGCTKNDGGVAAETTADATANAVTLISAESGGDYAIVRSDLASASVIAASQELVHAISDEVGVKVALKTDWYRDANGNPPAPKEILIGSTNREESVATEAEKRPNGLRDWAIVLKGDKLVVWGGGDEAVSEAVSYLTENCLKDGTLSVPENMDVRYRHEWELEDIRIGGVSVAEYQIVIPATGNDIEQMAAEELRRFISTKTGIVPEIVKDSAAKKETEREILIGNTARGSLDALLKDAGKYGSTITVSGTKLYIGGTIPLGTLAAVGIITEGKAGTMNDKIYEISKNTVNKEGDLMASGIAKLLQTYTDARAAAGRLVILENLRKYAQTSAADLKNVDIYGTTGINAVFLPADELIPGDLELANRIITKASHFMTSEIPDSVVNGNGIQGECDFTANRICRTFYAPEGTITENTMKEVRRFFLEDDFCSKYYSENHMLMFRVARYLAACKLENEMFKQYKKTGAELRKIDHEYLVSFLQYRAERGWAEFDSMGYGVEDFLSLINLYDCAPDKDLKTLAAMSMDTLLLSMITDSTENGIYGGAHGRNYDVVVQNMSSGLKFLFDLYFGGKDPYSKTAGTVFHAASFVYTSDYRPDPILYAIVADKQYPFTNRERTHNHEMNWEPKEYGFINKSTYNTELYSIGAVDRQDPFPATASAGARSYEEHQQTNWSLTFAENSKATLTTHHPGDTGTHRYWCGDSGCFCNHLFHNEKVVMGIYYIIGMNRTFNYIHAYVPQDEYSEVVEQKAQNRLFLRLNDAYACLRFSEPYAQAEDNPKELKIYDGNKESDIRIAMICETGDKAEYGSFEAFIAAMEKKEMKFDKEALTLSYGNLSYALEQKSKADIAEHSYIDGKELEYPYAYTYDSPYMKSEYFSGVIEVYYGNFVRTMDFEKVTDTTVEKK